MEKMNNIKILKPFSVKIISEVSFTIAQELALWVMNEFLGDNYILNIETVSKMPEKLQTWLRNSGFIDILPTKRVMTVGSLGTNGYAFTWKDPVNNFEWTIAHIKNGKLLIANYLPIYCPFELDEHRHIVVEFE